MINVNTLFDNPIWWYREKSVVWFDDQVNGSIVLFNEDIARHVDSFE